MIDYRLQVFRQVAEQRSITKAAQTLHLSQPAVTRHVRLLEEELRAPLFVRSAQGMSLTPEGVIYLEYVQQAMLGHEQVVQRLQSPTVNLSGRLRIGSNKTVLAYFLPDVLDRFRRRYPDVTCDVIDGNTDTIIGALLNARIDLALIEGPCRRPEIQIQPILEDELIWVCAPADPLAGARSPSIKSILRRPLITREPGAGSRQFMAAVLENLGFAWNDLTIAQEVPGPGAVKRLIKAGLGIGFVFRLSVAEDLALGGLVQIHCPRLTVRRPFSLLLPQGPAPQGIIRAFREVLLEPPER